MGNIIRTTLFCLHCDKETLHTITYSGRYLHRIKCEKCETEIALDRRRILETYAADTVHNILTKPHRLTEEMRKDLTAFITSLPIRIMTKPIRIAKEFIDTVKE